jgi:hypothetical protein
MEHNLSQLHVLGGVQPGDVLHITDSVTARVAARLLWGVIPWRQLSRQNGDETVKWLTAFVQRHLAPRVRGLMGGRPVTVAWAAGLEAAATGLHNLRESYATTPLVANALQGHAAAMRATADGLRALPAGDDGAWCNTPPAEAAAAAVAVGMSVAKPAPATGALMDAAEQC